MERGMGRYVVIGILGRPLGSRSLGEWVGEYINDCKGRKEKSVLWRHFKEDHNEEEQPYGLKVVSTAPGDPRLWQLTEEILIEEKKPLMNAKDEWGTEISHRRECLGKKVPRHKRSSTKGPWARGWLSGGPNRIGDHVTSRMAPKTHSISVAKGLRRFCR